MSRGSATPIAPTVPESTLPGTFDETKRENARCAERLQYLTLSDREREVLVMVAADRSDSEIAEQLAMNARIVETYKGHISKKLRLTHRADYVHHGLRADMLK